MTKPASREILDTQVNLREDRILTRAGLVRAVLMNLLGNAKKQSRNKEQKIYLNVESTKFPETASFIPDGASEYKNFVAFRVHDTGKGFPSQEKRKYGSYFTTMPEIGSNGFGLYFTGLVARVLRAPVEIKSSAGDTTVSFYHPIYEKSEARV